MDRAVEAGTEDFMTKPINKSDLLQRVRAMLAARQTKGELDRTLAYINAVEKGGQ
jgi:DNA-binding response OmpR family regulator